MASQHLLLVDDDRWLLESLSEWLQSEGFTVSSAATCRKAKQLIQQQSFDLILCDLRLEDGDGTDVLQVARKRAASTPVVMFSGYAGPETGPQMIAAGAFDLLSKPIIDQELLHAIRRALDQKRVSDENQRLKAALDRRFGLEGVLSHDARMIEIFDMIDSVADARATVLITGENGTGKSMIARALHQRSGRRDQSFVEVACGALPDALLESELFGHVAGAFTGATHNKTGKFHQADGGTIFLDEIGTASTALQVKLLRVLQEMHFEPLGSLETIQTDARVILATNEDLGRAVAEGRFRQDLFYRINVIHLELPSLRQRLDDLPLLIEHFLQDACKEFGRKVEGLTPAALEILRRYRWPGNIRELENVVQRAVLLCKSDWIDIPHLPQAVLTGVSAADAPRPGAGPSGQDGNFVAGLSISSLAPGQTLREALDGPERQIILDVLQRNQWNRNLTAEKLGINRTTLYKKIKRLGIEELSPTDSV